MDEKKGFTGKLPSSFIEIIDMLGLENALTLTKRFGGQNIYIPKPDTFEKEQRNHQIRTEFTGYNYRELAYKYKLSEIQIRTITNNKYY